MDLAQYLTKFASFAFPSSQGVKQPVPDEHPMGGLLEEEGLLGEVSVSDDLTSNILTRPRLVKYEL
jgi:hypothetical protein